MNNHRQFLLFVLTLVIVIGLFDYLTVACEYHTSFYALKSKTFAVFATLPAPL